MFFSGSVLQVEALDKIHAFSRTLYPSKPLFLGLFRILLHQSQWQHLSGSHPLEHHGKSSSPSQSPHPTQMSQSSTSTSSPLTSPPLTPSPLMTSRAYATSPLDHTRTGDLMPPPSDHPTMAIHLKAGQASTGSTPPRPTYAT